MDFMKITITILLFLFFNFCNGQFLEYKRYYGASCDQTSWERDIWLFINPVPDNGSDYYCSTFLFAPNSCSFRILNSTHIFVLLHPLKTSCAHHVPENLNYTIRSGSCGPDIFDPTKFSTFTITNTLTIHEDDLTDTQRWFAYQTYTNGNCSVVQKGLYEYNFVKTDIVQSSFFNFDSITSVGIEPEKRYNFRCNKTIATETIFSKEDSDSSWREISITLLDPSNPYDCKKRRFWNKNFLVSCISELPATPKVLEYQRWYNYWNPRCESSFWGIGEKPIGTCYHEWGEAFQNYNTDHSRQLRLFENHDCSGEILGVYYEPDVKEDNCETIQNSGLYPYYQRFEEFDHYFEDEESEFFSMVVLHDDVDKVTCEELTNGNNNRFVEYDIKTIGKELFSVEYFHSEYCIGSDDGFSFMNGKSIDGVCENGVLHYNLYSKSNNCKKEAISSVGDYCVHDIDHIYFFTCFPKICFGIFEYDSEKVCNGKGSCISHDVCDCDYDYYGKECEEEGHSDLWIAITVPTVTMLFLLLCCCFVCVALCCFLGQGILIGCFALPISLCVCCCSTCSVYLFQKKKLNRFGELKDDLYILLEERKAERNSEYMENIKINKNLFEIKMDDLKIKRVIGDGGSEAVVYLCTWKRQKVAFKCYKTRNVLTNKTSLSEFEKECSILGSLSHPGIVQWYGAVVRPPRIGMVIEYCSNSDLGKYINFKNMEDKQIKFETKLRFLLEISQAMDFLHEQKIIHRDLKPGNVLLNQNLSIKLVDFGISRFSEATVQQKTKHLGTNIYIAPELINSSNYNEKCDVFSFSILSFVILSQDLNPYKNMSSSESKNSNSFDNYGIEIIVSQNPFYRPLFSKQNDIFFPTWVKNLIVNCWDHNFKKRKSFGQISELLSKKYLEELKKREKSTPRNNNSNNSKKDEILVSLVNNNNNNEEEEEEEEDKMFLEKYERNSISNNSNNGEDNDGLVIFIKDSNNNNENNNIPERFFLLDKSISGLRKVIKEHQKWENKKIKELVVTKNYNNNEEGEEKKMEIDKDVFNLRMNSLLVVKFFEDNDNIDVLKDQILVLKEENKGLRKKLEKLSDNESGSVVT